MATTVFRVEKKENYTIISNYHLQDKNLSNKAKGLLTIMLSLPPNWDMTLKGLVSLSSDGIDAIRAQISELEKNGYLSRTRSRDELGRLQCTEYSIHELPVTKNKEKDSDKINSESNETELIDSTNTTPDNILYDEGANLVKPLTNEVMNALECGHKCFSQTEKNSDAKDRIIQIGKSDVVHVGKSNVDHMGKSVVDHMGKPYLGETYLGKSNAINNLPNKNTYQINNLSNQSNKNNKDKIDKDEESAEQLVQEREHWELIIKENIDYEYFSNKAENEKDNELQEFIDLSVDLIVDVITSSKPFIYIKGQKFPTRTIASRFRKLDNEHIEYVWYCLKKNTTEIKNIQSYILTALYNSFNSVNLHNLQQFNHNHPEWV